MMVDSQVLDIISAGVLLGRVSSVLSDFEAETVAEIGRRFVAFRRQAVVTEAEWAVLRTALEAMRGAMAVVTAHQLATHEPEAA
ncbi:hypothetical protein [Phenylobacterium sp.]|uniref:hypothetical protein n=1 Tax=Phenylobacterium sp. TaxID=1871053 RepID=UPI00272FE5A6|nr:hypothetical protein [Phenylobacterium sp.]MDP1617315.1 hypothetical protein [Phenylobacterium sp.]MDP1985687.1 hypothetical protein [Phenylobacterium sp.]